MKPPPFEYIRASSVSEAIDALSSAPEASKLISGGQSLVPLMNMRLARPDLLVDIGEIRELGDVSSHLSIRQIGSTVTHAQLEALDTQDPLSALLRRAASHIGHLPIRTRGTFGGSIAHCDPSSEWCVIARLLDALMNVEGPAGRRAVPAADFFRTVYTSALEAEEILVSVDLPEPQGTWHLGFEEYSRTSGDFAIVIAAAAIQVADGQVTAARICLGGVADVPVRASLAERQLVGASWPPEGPDGSVVAAVSEAALDGLEPPSDVQADASYRLDLVRGLVGRALRNGVKT